MYHKQVKLFVTFIVESNITCFKSFLFNIQNGESFPKMFNKIFKMTIPEKWEQFLLSLKY